MVAGVNTVHFTRRLDMMNHHFKYPGLAVHTLWTARQKVGGEQPRNSAQPKKIDCSTWASQHSGLKEVRDQREVALLSRLLLDLGHNRLEVAADLCAQRIREIVTAKKDGSSWDKASVISLMGSSHGGHALVPDGAFVA